MAGKNRFSVSDRFEFLQGLVTEFQDTDSEGKSMLTYALHIYICAWFSLYNLYSFTWQTIISTYTLTVYSSLSSKSIRLSENGIICLFTSWQRLKSKCWQTWPTLPMIHPTWKLCECSRSLSSSWTCWQKRTTTLWSLELVGIAVRL